MEKTFHLLAFVLLFGLSTSLSLAAQPSADATLPQPPARQAATEGFPVTLGEDEVMRISSSPIASLTPAARAELIQKNLQTFADGDTEVARLQVIAQPNGLGIGAGNQILMVIGEQEAIQAGTAIQPLAEKTLSRLRSAVMDYRAKRSWETYGLGAGLTLTSIVGLWLTLRLSRKGFNWLTARTLTLSNLWKSGLHFKTVVLLSSKQIERLLLLVLKTMRLFVMLLCWYFFLPLILSFFPETRKIGARIFDYLLTPFSTIFHTVVDLIPNLFYILVICVIAYYALKVLSYFFILLENGDLEFEWFYDDWAKPTYQIVRFLVIVTALISAYPYIPGSSSEAFQGIGLVLGAVLSFASSSAISNIVAGIILTYTRAFRLNDRIKVGETIGDVVEKTLLVTRIKTIKHVVVTIPNSLVMSSQIINYSTSAAEGQGVILHTSVTIGYDVPHQQVQDLLIAAALDTAGLLKQPAPFVFQTSLDDWYVSYEINAYTREPEKMAQIYSALHQQILEKFDAAGMEIMSPHYFAMRDGNATTVPATLAQPGYVPPAFGVTQRP